LQQFGKLIPSKHEADTQALQFPHIFISRKKIKTKRRKMSFQINFSKSKSWLNE
jgi:hypothetical protein